MLKDSTFPSRQVPLGITASFKYFSIILTLFSATWLISNIAAVKLVYIFGVTFTGGFIVFPFTMMLGNVIVEVYGYKNARQSIWAGFILNILFVFFINAVNFMPPSPTWELSEQFQNILVQETRIIFASLISFLMSDFASSFLMAKMKIRSHGKSLIKRIVFASIVSISLDIVSFILLAFWGVVSAAFLIKLMTVVYVKKFVCQIALLPLVWYLISRLKKAENVEIYDFDTKFNPFSLDNVYELRSVNQFNSSEVLLRTSKGAADEF